ncbi:symmetrical bis(5'-nucleosyl)-tetraphosphatase [Salinibius halmophilus]|uniref:symmetrical bis(5'-nucleosyl)-tetraphosphatase n=1 Tax=Salinibius halmophilus TaxID=1853216 RepID=UPI000E66B064|nr:symmetrical bis(5'-nucleosyl)-tetraphosphatase [Salinibius halmophilus]
MARYAVGDLQGNLTPLKQLLAIVDFQFGKDELWLVGDIVNRGPESLASLEFVMQHDHCMQMVLGNHDLSLLAKAHGHGKPSKKDTIDEILNAPKRNKLFDFLYQQPLAHASDTYLMVHAGLPPVWSDQQLIDYSVEVSSVLQSKKQRAQYFDNMYGNTPDTWHEQLSGWERLRLITNYCTRMRFCDAQGKLEFAHSGSPDCAPEGFAPWFSWPNPKRQRQIVFGHWAALMGATGHSEIIGLDTGYVWGNQLTLIDLDSKQRWQVQKPS